MAYKRSDAYISYVLLGYQLILESKTIIQGQWFKIETYTEMTTSKNSKCCKK